MGVLKVNENADKLRKIRKSINDKQKEIVNLELEKEEIWQKIYDEFNENLVMYRKTEGLSGLREALGTYVGEELLVILFEQGSMPTAKGLSFIEENTGLRFDGNIHDRYQFGFVI